jgi:transposase-like protein
MDTPFTPTAPFPFARFRALRFGTAKPPCPHCGAPRPQRWGTFSGRQRYRCTLCKRTFSDFTGTPLAYLKLVERWTGFCLCVLASRTVRDTARALGVDKDTAFRWRHRLLLGVAATDTTMLEGVVALYETWFAHSEKGSRRLDRPARRRKALHRSAITPVWVVLARGAGRGDVTSDVVGRHRPDADDLLRLIGHRLDPGAELLTTTGHYGAAARMAERILRRHRRAALHAHEIRRAQAYARDLHRWIRRFRGVATRYLTNYLAWHRLLHRAGNRPVGRATAWLLSARFP